MPSLDYKKKMGSEDSRGKRLAFPTFTSFSEMFSEWNLMLYQNGNRTSVSYPQVNNVDDYCSGRRTDLNDSIHVKARPELITWINGNMILTDRYDSWYFEIVQREDGMLVVVRNSTILASRWLALLDADLALRDIRRKCD